MKGTVTLFKQTYGFIETDELEDDVFVHQEEIDGDQLEEGTEVEFDQEDAEKGPKAVNVTKV
jgi:CspA family cold shock protein